MITRILLVIVMFLVTLGSTHAAPSWGPGIIWDQKIVQVADYTSDDYNGVVEPILEAWDAAIPGVDFRHSDKGPRSCRWVTQHAKAPLSLCTGDVPEPWSGVTAMRWDRHRFERVRVRVEEVEDRDYIICHELGHALTGMRDNYEYNEDSCVRGWGASFPTALDLEYATHVYRKHRR